jgi:hypothetical protein
MRYQMRCVVIRKQLALSEVVDYYVDVGTVKPLILPLPRESPLLACQILWEALMNTLKRCPGSIVITVLVWP